MFTIHLGLSHGLIFHWALVLIHDASTPDESGECPASCPMDASCPHPQIEPALFDLDLVADVFTSSRRVHILHVIQRDDVFTFHHEPRRSAVLHDDGPSLILSDPIGSCTNVQLGRIIQKCGAIPMPGTGADPAYEHCQDWVWSAIRERLILGATLTDVWEQILDEVKYFETGRGT